MMAVLFIYLFIYTEKLTAIVSSIEYFYALTTVDGMMLYCLFMLCGRYIKP